MPVLCQYVGQRYARELLADAAGGVGYLLRDRVCDRVFSDEASADAIRAVALGGTVMDPGVVSEHSTSIFAQPGLVPGHHGNRRALAGLNS